MNVPQYLFRYFAPIGIHLNVFTDFLQTNSDGKFSCYLPLAICNNTLALKLCAPKSSEEIPDETSQTDAQIRLSVSARTKN